MAPPIPGLARPVTIKHRTAGDVLAGIAAAVTLVALTVGVPIALATTALATTALATTTAPARSRRTRAWCRSAPTPPAGSWWIWRWRTA